MSKTVALRALVQSTLQTTQGDTYHKTAPNDAAYPYKTYELSSVAFPNTDRDDLSLVVDIWDRGLDPKTAENIADDVEALFTSAIIPRPPLYPAFFRENRYNVEDPDKTLQHIQLHFSVQLHETEE